MGMAGLYVGLSGLQTSSNSLNTTANNLANVNTSGYVRQQVVNGDKSYNFVGTTAATTTTSQPVTTTSSATTAPAEDVVYGDADNDGRVGIADVVKVMMYATNKSANPLTETELNNADVYNRGDGVFISDALSIQKKVAQVIDSLPES